MTKRRSRAAVHSQGRGGRPSCSVSSFSRAIRCFSPSSLRASTRSSLDVSSRTRPISRRYIRTGSSSTSRVSVSASHSASSFSMSASAGPSSEVFSGSESPEASSHWSSGVSASAWSGAPPMGLDLTRPSPSSSSSTRVMIPSRLGCPSDSSFSSMKSSGFSSRLVLRLTIWLSPSA